MAKKTPLYDQHLALNARMVEFAGWEMPINYGSQIEEHQATRSHAGLFDVSHMNIVDIKNKTAKDFLKYLLANDISKLIPGKALYSCMLNHQGGVIDDLIVYMLSGDHYQLVLNAGTKEKDLQWLQQQNTFHCQITPREDLAILALQGPYAMRIAESVFSGDFGAEVAALKPFCFAVSEHILAARTGYTGEDGLELIVSAEIAVNLWQKILGAGAHPIGLGARDTLRLEAGLNLYGQDMDESTSPLASNLGWTVVFKPEERDFIGREALVSSEISQKFVGLILEKGGILRHDQKIFSENQENNQEIGVITSGGFSPVLNCSIALARIINKDITEAFVDIRGKLLPVKITKPAFVRRGKKLV
jgi:aminomethyltransferase